MLYVEIMWTEHEQQITQQVHVGSLLIFLVKITRFYDDQTWPTDCLRNSGGAHHFAHLLWALFSLLCFSGADWLGRQTLVVWLQGLL